MAYKRRCNSCIHILCDVVGRNRPERNIDFVCESIVMFEKSYGRDYKEETRELALEAISKYGPGTAFENDERMLPIYRILGTYSRSMSSTDIYDKLHEKGLFTSSAMFYFDWVDVHLIAGNFDKAKSILATMEKAIGADNGKYAVLRRRIYGDREKKEGPRAQQPITRSEMPVKPVAPVVEASKPARRNLFGRSTPVRPDHPRRFVDPIVEDEDAIKAPPVAARAAPTLREEPIVLPHIVAAPPIDMSIVSPSIELIQSGQVPANFCLPPVFSFSNAANTASYYRPARFAATKETSSITSSIMSPGVMAPLASTLAAHPLAGLPSHPAQIGNSHFAMPDLTSYRNHKENTENVDPYGSSSSVAGRRDIIGVLQPTQGVSLDRYAELDAEQPQRTLTNYELKKARLKNPHNQAAVRKIFADPAAQLANAFKSLGIAATPTTTSF